VSTRYDVAVVGGGCAGTAAAVGAAQAGARTVLVESYGCLGRAATMRGVSALCGLYTEADDSEQVVFGVGEQLLSGLRSLDAVVEKVRFRGVVAVYDPEAVKRVLDLIAGRAGVDVLFHTSVVDAERDGSGLTSATLHGHGGSTVLEAGTWVDASGDGDLTSSAGASWRYGNDGHSADDVTRGVRHDDAVARGSWAMEYHDTAGGASTWLPVADRGTYDIPLRCLMSEDTPNLYVAGRLADGDRLAGGSLRVMGTALGTGHAAGVAAAAHVHSGCPPSAGDVLAELQRQDARLP
jgi:flavin-dependent dehydrogenase